MNTYCTDGKKFGISMIFFLDIFERHLLYSPRLHLFDQKYSYIVKYYYNLKQPFSIWIYFKK